MKSITFTMTEGFPPGKKETKKTPKNKKRKQKSMMQRLFYVYYEFSVSLEKNSIGDR